MNYLKSFGYILVGFCFTIPAQAQFTYQGCPNVSSSDFNVVNLVTAGVNEPIKLALNENSQGNVDVYWVERGGAVKRYSNGNTTTLGTISVMWQSGAHPGNVEEGLVGIALDPDFNNNGYMYFFFSPPNPNVFRLARYTLNGNSIGSATTLLDIPTQRDECCHTGGGMQFDAYGDLWIAVGNNNFNGGGFINENTQWQSDEWGASSTAGMRGGILRIHPEGNGYTIPSGNFGEHFSAYWQGQGNQSLANDYLNPNLVFPEIYIKGTRNAYSLSLDPVRRWVMYGDVGPDYGGQSEEVNLYTEPVFAGWPYFVGNNQVNQDLSTNSGFGTPNAPINDSRWNTGVQQLPPASAAAYVYQQSCAITGPLYRYDGSLQSNIKLPPHFDRKWFMTDCSQGFVRVGTVNNNGGLSGNPASLMNNGTFQNPLDMKFGPDGALYVVNYGTQWFGSNQAAIKRVEYDGPTCDAPNLLPEYAACMDPNYDEYDPNADGHDSTACLTLSVGLSQWRSQMLKKLRIQQTPEMLTIRVDSDGDYDFQIVNLKGRVVYHTTGIGRQPLEITLSGLQAGLYQLIVSIDEKRLAKNIVLQ